ncbi:MAG: 3-oxoacyl-[acyl-carrier-protein] reductase [Dehalococcoidia bacterium]|nr:3-oxoacyl-[acyl-carrier-protein] reductase [Dehalococcoidia bacterium]MDZ4245911.1 3-oxoacyl-[acyl-carrier-protein] reductase [Dehalococcoidia bacterium]
MNSQSPVALVTGSGRGIGRAIALKLFEKGAAVVINDVGDAGPAEEVAGYIREKGGQSSVLLADVSKENEVTGLFESIISSYGRIDILVNNAGITRDQLLLRLSEEDWDRVLDINLKGAFLCTRAALRYMVKQRRGRIVNICSVVGQTGNAGQANYAAAKGGLIALTKTCAKEVATRGITVNAIAPGFIDTEMTRRLNDNIKQEVLKQIPAGQFGTTQDVAGAVAFFVSDDASYITGQVLRVDGGLVMA